MKAVSISLLFLWTYSLVIVAQDSNYSEIILYLQNSTNNRAISFANVYNESSRTGAITDSSGILTIRAKAHDTLVFLSLGYYGHIYIVQVEDFETALTIHLEPRYYEIEEVKITLPRSYEAFKQAILKVNIDKERPFSDLPQFNPYKTPERYANYESNEKGGITIRADDPAHFRFGSVKKSEAKVWFLKQQELKQGRVDDKFNRQLVSNLTGFYDDELTQFIGYCNFSFNFLFTTSPYDIAVSIERKHKEYLNCCYEKTDQYSRN